jgi:hypothetical protein
MIEYYDTTIVYGVLHWLNPQYVVYDYIHTHTYTHTHVYKHAHTKRQFYFKELILSVVGTLEV